MPYIASAPPGFRLYVSCDGWFSTDETPMNPHRPVAKSDLSSTDHVSPRKMIHTSLSCHIEINTPRYTNERFCIQTDLSQQCSTTFMLSRSFRAAFVGGHTVSFRRDIVVGMSCCGAFVAKMLCGEVYFPSAFRAHGFWASFASSFASFCAQLSSFHKFCFKAFLTAAHLYCIWYYICAC